jgi:hypothetical protein
MEKLMTNRGTEKLPARMSNCENSGVPRPSDFPFGSPKSRAAARALLEKRKNPLLSLYDQDALRIYNGASHLDATMAPSYPDLELTAIWARGKQLDVKKYGAVPPAHLDGHLARATYASLCFEEAFDREPIEGDVLRYKHVELVHSAKFNALRFNPLIAAWGRRLPDMICPLKFEDGRLFKRLCDADCKEVGTRWLEIDRIQPHPHWLDVETEFKQWTLGVPALLPDFAQVGNMPTIPAFVFTGLVDGEHRHRPAAAEELK